MKIAVCSFEVTGDIKKNVSKIMDMAGKAKSMKTDLAVFPECALTGYPPRDLNCAKDVSNKEIHEGISRLHCFSEENGIAILTGTIWHGENGTRNRACLIRPDKQNEIYDKRALWGWDRDNFSEGTEKGIFQFGNIRLGVRICYEIRFPEYFRELYLEKTDADIVLFYDVSDSENRDRYELICGHIRTRAVENVTTMICVYTCGGYPTAPTGIYDRSGRVIKETEPGKEAILIADIEPKEDDFGERGRREISDWLLTKR